MLDAYLHRRVASTAEKTAFIFFSPSYRYCDNRIIDSMRYSFSENGRYCTNILKFREFSHQIISVFNKSIEFFHWSQRPPRYRLSKTKRAISRDNNFTRNGRFDWIFPSRNRVAPDFGIASPYERRKALLLTDVRKRRTTLPVRNNLMLFLFSTVVSLASFTPTTFDITECARTVGAKS